MRLRPMTLFETSVSTGQVSLRSLFDGDFKPTLDPGVTVPTLVDCIVKGGWPALLGAPVRDAQRWTADYLRAIVEVDLPRLGVRRPSHTETILASRAAEPGPT